MLRFGVVLAAFTLGGCYPWVGPDQHAKNQCKTYIDRDGDGYGQGATGLVGPCGRADGNRVGVAGDCDDADPTTFPHATELCDGITNDCTVGGLREEEFDVDGDGFVACVLDVDVGDWRGPQPIVGGEDCDETDVGRRPGLPELCDKKDNDCDGRKDEGLDLVDLDGDGHFDEDCGGDDCNDAEPLIHAGAPEVCGNGHDDDCDGTVDNRDFDNDGFVDRRCLAQGGDCDDNDDAVHPGSPEVCDGVDNDCDGERDNVDLDADQHRPIACGGDDCDDGAPNVHPGMVEDCATIGVDDDCSGLPEDLDGDGDRYVACDGSDCDDSRADVNPGQAEVCGAGNFVDEDCSGDFEDLDADRDGAISTGCLGGDDCDDNNRDVAPHRAELCANGIDDDCSGAPDDLDLDQDGHLDPACAGDDCDDLNPNSYLGAAEFPDGQDNDCDLLVDEGTSAYDDDGDCFCEGTLFCSGSVNSGCVAWGIRDCDDTNPLLDPADADGDGYTTCDGDCDDASSGLNLADLDSDGLTTCDGDCDDLDMEAFPGNIEVFDGVDNDCDGTADRAIDLATGVKIVGEGKRVELGASIASSGPLTGDAGDVLIIGVPAEDLTVTGRVAVLRAPVPTTGVHPISTAANALFDGPPNAPFGTFGNAVADVGDVNGDGFGDILVGASQADKAYVIAGAADWATFAAQTFSSHAGFLGPVNSTTGLTVGPAGDLNGDTLQDMLIGAPNLNGTAGALFVVYGTNAWPPASDLLNHTVVHGEPAAAISYHGLAADTVGDIYGTGADDVLLGSYSYDIPAGSLNVGAAYILDSATLSGVGNVSEFEATAIGGTNQDDYLGFGVAGGGDLDGDGDPDFTVKTGPGTVDLFFEEGFAGPTATILGEGTKFGQAEGVAIVGDVCGGPGDDLLISDVDPGDDNQERGKVYLLCGDFVAGQTYDAETDAAATFLGEDVGDNASRVTGGADLDNDGCPDFAIGAPRNGPQDEGAVYVFFGLCP